MYDICFIIYDQCWSWPLSWSLFPYQRFNFQLILASFYPSVTRCKFNIILIYLEWPLSTVFSEMNMTLTNIIENKPNQVWTRYTSIKIRYSSIHIITAGGKLSVLHQNSIMLEVTLNQDEETIKSSHEMISFKLHFFLSNLLIYKDWDIVASPLITQGLGRWNLTTFRCESMNVEAPIWKIRSICKFQQVHNPTEGKLEPSE